MDYPLELTRANRLLLARAFRNNKKVDYSIDCVVEGQMGNAFVDDPDHPRAFRISIGPFWYFAGEARSPGAIQMMRALPPSSLLMPTLPDWIALAREVYQYRLQAFTRFSFSPDALSQEHLEDLISRSKYRDCLVPIDAGLAGRMLEYPERCLEIEGFDSTQDFVQRGIGYAVIDRWAVLGAAYSSLVCSRGIEVSIYVVERHRQHGIGTAVGSKLLLECLKQNRRPNWDAANGESCKLAEKLGYRFLEAYEAYYY